MVSTTQTMPDPSRPVGQHPSAHWEPSTYRTRPQQRDQRETGYNVPRIVLVGAVLVGVLAAILIAVL